MVNILVFIGLLGASPGDDPTAEAIRLEERSLEERRRIVSGVFEVETEGFADREGRRREYQQKTTIHLDGPSIRQDLERIRPDRMREVQSRGPKFQVWYTDQAGVGGGPVNANVTEAAGASGPGPAKTLVDPRMIGLIPMNFLNLWQASLGECLGGRVIKRVVAVVDDEVDGRRCRKITQEDLQGVTRHIWIDPARDHCVVRYQVERRTPRAPSVVDLTSRLAYIPEIRRWFPESCVVEVRAAGAVIERERATIHVTRMNSPIDPATFALQSLGIPPGTGVDYMGEGPLAGRMVEWNGSGLVRLDDPDWPPTSRPIRTWLLGVAAISAICAAVVAWAVLRRRPSAT